MKTTNFIRTIDYYIIILIYYIIIIDFNTNFNWIWKKKNMNNIQLLFKKKNWDLFLYEKKRTQIVYYYT